MIRNDENRPVLGIIGFGKLGTVVARLGLAAGHTVRVAGSGEREVVEFMADVVAPGVAVGLRGEIATGSDIVILALPLHRFRELPADDLAGKLVIDAMNYWRDVDGPRELWAPAHLSTSEVVQQYMSGASVVKGFSHIGYHELEEAARPLGDPTRKAMALAGDRAADVHRVGVLVSDLGFDPLSIGSLSEGRRLEPGGPAFGAVEPVLKLASLLGLPASPPALGASPNRSDLAVTRARAHSSSSRKG
jgi:predicted dinucleotide-binding enzyme